MRHTLLAATALVAATPATAQIATPTRPITDPKSLTSPANPAARPIPIDDIGTSRSLADATWSADGKAIFVVTNLTGRFNVWRTAATGSWPVQLTQSDDAQSGLAVSPDGKWVYFQQDKGGNEYTDIYRVPASGGAVENLTNTPDVQESGIVVAKDGRLAIATKTKGQAQSNLAILETDGRVRALTAEKDPQFGWGPIAWINDGRTLIANRFRIDSAMTEVWAIDAETGRVTAMLSKPDTVYAAAGASPDGKILSVTTNDTTGQAHAGLYDIAAKSWRWLKPTPWEQTAGRFVDGGRAFLARTNADSRSTLIRVDTATMAETPLPLAPGVNSLVGGAPVAPGGTTLLALHSGADSPANLYVVDLATNAAAPVTQLAMASLSPDQLPRSQVVTYKSFDGTPVSAIVTMPYNLKRDGTNPAIVIPHGGPTGQAQDGFGRDAAALASRGYVVIQPNFRGSTGYGKAFQKANFKDLGGGDLKDTIAAKIFLVDSGYVDARRVGITGGSYGGFMTLMAIGRTPDAFAAAVQQYGIINWRTMYRDQDELLKAYQRSLLGTPDSDAAVYDASSPLTYIRATKVPLLSLQGENDIRVPRGQAQEVADILKARGNTVETVFYPAEGHGFRKRENQLDALRRMIGWFDTYLKPRATN